MSEINEIMKYRNQKRVFEDRFEAGEVLIGGGFIGVKVSDEINRLGKEITIIEHSPNMLGGGFRQ